jgi:hypothetical protein
MRTPLWLAELPLVASPSSTYRHGADESDRRRDRKRNVYFGAEIRSTDPDRTVRSCGSLLEAAARSTRCARRLITGAVIAGLMAVAVIAVPSGSASAAPCDGTSCVPHLRTGAHEGDSCVAARLYPFGLDAAGRTLICYATYRNPTTSSWTPVPPIVGVRDYGALCSERGIAQSPDGVALACRAGIWDRYTPALPVN